MVCFHKSNRHVPRRDPFLPERNFPIRPSADDEAHKQKDLSRVRKGGPDGIDGFQVALNFGSVAMLVGY